MMASRALSLATYLVCGLICCSLISSVASDIITNNPPGKNSLITLTEDDWEQILTGEWMVEFHAPWCPACRALQPEWKKFAGWSAELGIKIAAVDVTVNPGLSGRFLVTALPTIYHVKDGVFRQYKSTRDSEAFVTFIEEKKWQSLEPINAWKSPDSLQMSFVSQLFKISMGLRSVHNSLVEDYGIPYWGSYIVFAFATILFGAILGLIIVCIIDVLWPAKMSDVPYKELPNQQKLAKDQSKDSDDENIDDIVDQGEGTDDKSSGSEEVLAASQSEDQADDDDQAKKQLRKRRPRKDGQ